jgi:hypothetical protein
MIGLELLLGHLVGDYVVQNDWMALNKTHTWPKQQSWVYAARTRSRDSYGQPWSLNVILDVEVYEEAMRKFWLGNLACTIHCLFYTIAVAAFTFGWMPWWGYLACFFIHWPTDRFRLALEWMVQVSGQEKFATGPLAPWSVIIVDNIWHLLTLYVIARLAGVA